MSRKGRPTKEAKPGTRASLGLKVTASLKARLEQEAAKTGRTQSQEAEYRLQRTFDDAASAWHATEIMRRLDKLIELAERQIAQLAAGTGGR